jgi:beta-galactosidase
LTPAAPPNIDRFLFGASVYPEIQTPEEWRSMLAEFELLNFTVLRVGESAWGHLEPHPGVYTFDWLHTFLDEADRRGFKAVLGTNTYIAPQWMAAQYPDVLEQGQPGRPTHPMYRKAASLSHPAYRDAARQLISALGEAFKDHPAVIGWQLDNEIEAVLGPDYNPYAERAWTEWLKTRFGTVDRMNEQLGLKSWGMQAPDFESVRQPWVSGHEGSAPLPALSLANLRFRRDVILQFLEEQAQALRDAGVTHWITSNWMPVWNSLADDPKTQAALDLASLNVYPGHRADLPYPAGQSAAYFAKYGWMLDQARSAHGLGHFLVTETRIGVTGSVQTWNRHPSRREYRMWMLQLVAFGANGLIYWTGNRWHGGHWPHWGGVLDWSGTPEPDAEWASELGQFFQDWGEVLLQSPVDARSAVFTDFDQRSALDVYPHSPSSKHLLPLAVDALHRLGIGSDTVNGSHLSDTAYLQRYDLVLVPAATVLDDPNAATALETFVRNGGRLIILPWTAFQHRDGVFRRDGFAANLAEISGAVVRTVRRMGTAADAESADHIAEWSGGDLVGSSTIGLDGFVELLDVGEANVLARLRSDDDALNDRPIASIRSVDGGKVVHLGFWPGDDRVLELVTSLMPDHRTILRTPAPPGVHLAPRTDGSTFVVNTAAGATTVQLAGRYRDRISSREVRGEVMLDGYDVLWLDQT